MPKVSRTLSKYDDITSTRRGKESVLNKQTDVTKSEFESNLGKSGYESKVSKDGKAMIFSKDGKSYTIRNNSKGITTADFRNNQNSGDANIKIRLKSENH